MLVVRAPAYPIASMSFGLDISRAFRKPKAGSINIQRVPNADLSDKKIQQLLGLKDNLNSPQRNNSSSSGSTGNLQSVSFSDATTARVSTIHSSSKNRDLVPQIPELGLKASSVLLREDYQNANKVATNTDSEQLKSFPSNSSLHSFYDRSNAPLSVSQQTSNSSTRDFALRKDTPSILTSTSQEKEHAAQLRIFTRSKSKKKRLDNENLITSEYRPATGASQPSTTQGSAFSTSLQPPSTANISLKTSKSGSRISIIQAQTPGTESCPAPTSNMVAPDHPFPLTKPTIEPGHRKINVRRPKAGTKNWFDSLDDSSDDDNVSEPQLQQSFVHRLSSVEDLNSKALAGRPAIPPRSKLRSVSKETLQQNTSTTVPPRRPHPLQSHPTFTATVSPKSTPSSDSGSTPTSTVFTEEPPKHRKPNPLAQADLKEQSILYLSSSEDEDDDDSDSLIPLTPKPVHQTFLRESLMSQGDDSDFEIAEAWTAESGIPKYRQVVHSKSQRNSKSHTNVASKRSSDGELTYLRDYSSENAVSEDEIISSFPPTPVESVPSKHTSIRDSIASDAQSMLSTRVMTVTKQEESLIAAMRLKKAAMKRNTAAAHQKLALQILEHGAKPSQQQSEAPSTSCPSVSQDRPHDAQCVGPATQAPSIPERRQVSRSTSVTTFQSESWRDPSIRSSFIAESSDELELPYTAMDNFSSTMIPASLRPSSSFNRKDRDTFLSTTSTATATTVAPVSPVSPVSLSSNYSSHRSHRSYNSHVVMLDNLDQQLAREEIPSQLFMERPFIGWERRAQMATQ